MSSTELALKIFLIWFVGMLLLSVSINLLLKKENRKTLKELVKEDILISLMTCSVIAVIAAFSWFLFEVV